MKRAYALVLAACLLGSGCGQGRSVSQETVGQPTEQAAEIETERETETNTKETEEETETTQEEIETESERKVTICTGIESRIVRKDEKFSHIKELDDYLNGKGPGLLRLYYLDEYSIQGRLYKGDEAQEWTQEDWDLVKPLEQTTTGDMGYGKIDYNNDGITEYFYRIVERKCLTATGYEVSDDRHEITGNYDLQELFKPEYAEGSSPFQLWFLDMEGTVVSFSLVKNRGNVFRIYAFLMEGDTVSILEERYLETETKQVSESEADSADNINAQVPWDFTGEDPTAYNLSWEELKKLRQEREIRKEGQETDLPRELAGLLQDILIRQSSAGWLTENISVEDFLEPYRAKNCEVDEAGAKKFLGDSMSSYLHSLSGAYVADLDGDGKEEIIMCCYYGASIGYENIEILWQKEDGTSGFTGESYTYWYSYTELLFIGGHYYYVAELRDYSTGGYEGFLVFSFPGDGTIKLDKVAMESQENGKVWKKLYENETLEFATLDSIQSYIESKKSKIEKEELWQGEVEILYEGSGYDFAVETFHLWGDAPKSTVVDFDNDGEMECCYKKIASGHNWLQLAAAILKKQGSYIRQLDIDFPGYSFKDIISSEPRNLWFEEFDGKNYIFRLNRLSGSADYFLTVQLIQDRKLYPVMNYLLLDKKVCRYEEADPEYYINFK